MDEGDGSSAVGEDVDEEGRGIIEEGGGRAPAAVEGAGGEVDGERAGSDAGELEDVVGGETREEDQGQDQGQGREDGQGSEREHDNANSGGQAEEGAGGPRAVEEVEEEEEEDGRGGGGVEDVGIEAAASDSAVNAGGGGETGEIDWHNAGEDAGHGHIKDREHQTEDDENSRRGNDADQGESVKEEKREENGEENGEEKVEKDDSKEQDRGEDGERAGEAGADEDEDDDDAAESLLAEVVREGEELMELLGGIEAGDLVEGIVRGDSLVGRALRQNILSSSSRGGGEEEEEEDARGCISDVVTEGRELFEHLNEADAVALAHGILGAENVLGAALRFSAREGQEGQDMLADFMEEGGELVKLLGGEEGDGLLEAVARGQSPVAHSIMVSVNAHAAAMDMLVDVAKEGGDLVALLGEGEAADEVLEAVERGESPVAQSLRCMIMAHPDDAALSSPPRSAGDVATIQPFLAEGQDSRHGDVDVDAHDGVIDKAGEGADGGVKVEEGRADDARGKRRLEEEDEGVADEGMGEHQDQDVRELLGQGRSQDAAEEPAAEAGQQEKSAEVQQGEEIEVEMEQQSAGAEKDGLSEETTGPLKMQAELEGTGLPLEVPLASGAGVVLGVPAGEHSPSFVASVGAAAVPDDDATLSAAEATSGPGSSVAASVGVGIGETDGKVVAAVVGVDDDEDDDDAVIAEFEESLRVEEARIKAEKQKQEGDGGGESDEAKEAGGRGDDDVKVGVSQREEEVGESESHRRVRELEEMVAAQAREMDGLREQASVAKVLKVIERPGQRKEYVWTTPEQIEYENMRFDAERAREEAEAAVEAAEKAKKAAMDELFRYEAAKAEVRLEAYRQQLRRKEEEKKREAMGAQMGKENKGGAGEVKGGLLKVKSSGPLGWERRHVVLRAQSLLVYPEGSSTLPINVVGLETVLKAGRVGAMSLEVVHGVGHLLMEASSAFERDQWVRCFDTALARFRRTSVIEPKVAVNRTEVSRPAKWDAAVEERLRMEVETRRRAVAAAQRTRQEAERALDRARHEHIRVDQDLRMCVSEPHVSDEFLLGMPRPQARDQGGFDPNALEGADGSSKPSAVTEIPVTQEELKMAVEAARKRVKADAEQQMNNTVDSFQRKMADLQKTVGERNEELEAAKGMTRELESRLAKRDRARPASMGAAEKKANAKAKADEEAAAFADGAKLFDDGMMVVPPDWGGGGGFPGAGPKPEGDGDSSVSSSRPTTAGGGGRARRRSVEAIRVFVDGAQSVLMQGGKVITYQDDDGGERASKAPPVGA